MFDNIFLWAQIIGLTALCFGIFSMQLKNSRHIILFETPSGILWGIQYILLGAHAGALINFMVATRAISLVYAKQSYLLPIIVIYLITVWGISFYNFQNWVDLLPLLATTGSCYVLFHRDNRPLIARGLILTSSIWLAYNIIVDSWVGIACSVFYIASCIVGICRHENWNLNRSPINLFKSLFTLPPVLSKELAYV